MRTRVIAVIARGQGAPGTPAMRVEIDADERTTVLDVLEAARKRAAPDLVYRRSCHHGSCGTCAVEVNGVGRLACTTRVLDVAETEIVIGPLAGAPLLADVATDPSRRIAAFPEEYTSLRPSEAVPGGEAPPEVGTFIRFEDCIECGLCVSACPVSARFLGPAVLAAVERQVLKWVAAGESEQARRLLLRAAGDGGVDGCVRAFECSRVCPTRVYPSRRIAELKRAIEGRSIGA